MTIPGGAWAENATGVTGEGGCYFGDPDCGNPQQTPPAFEPSPRTPDPAPYPNEPLVCVTSYGTCNMLAGGLAYESCFCPGLAYGFPATGITSPQSQIAFTTPPNVASVCATNFGFCGMSQAIPRFSSCYCPSWNGPVWGTSE